MLHALALGSVLILVAAATAAAATAAATYYSRVPSHLHHLMRVL